MSGIDEHGLVDFGLEFDGRIISAAGGGSGNFKLINGQTITFPWKPQQELAGSEPAVIQVIDVVGSVPPLEWFKITGAKLNTESHARTPVLALASFYTNGTEGYAALGCGTNNIAVHGGSAGTIVEGPFTTQVSAVPGSASINGDPDVQIIATDDILMDAADLLQAVGNRVTVFADGANQQLTLWSDTGDVLVQAGDQVMIDSVGTMILEADADLTIRTTGAGDDILVSAPSATVEVSGVTVTVGTTNSGDVELGAMFGPWVAQTTAMQQPASLGKTVNHAKYIKLGRTVIFAWSYTATSAGTGGNNLTVNLPFTAASASPAFGAGWVFNGGANTVGTIAPTSTTTVGLVVSTGFYQTALAIGGAFIGVVVYEATS